MPTSPSATKIADEVATCCYASRARAESRRITAIYDEALRPVDLRVTQLNVLVAVLTMGGRPQHELADRLSMDGTSLSRTLSRLEGAGWIYRTAGEDARERTVSLTPSGRGLLRRAYPLWRNAQQRAESN